MIRAYEPLVSLKAGYEIFISGGGYVAGGCRLTGHDFFIKIIKESNHPTARRRCLFKKLYPTKKVKKPAQDMENKAQYTPEV